MRLYHGGRTVIEIPEIRTAKYNKDFHFGFYCTKYEDQAIRWATRYLGKGVLNEYEFLNDETLKMLYFDTMTEEWLDFIVSCRIGKPHDYDIVEGPMANDTIFNFFQNFVDGDITRAAFWELAKFKKPTHQISFHTARALKTLTFKGGREVDV